MRFLGNMQAGVDLTLQDLHRHYDAVLVANGAAVDRRLGIPGENMAGSFSATDWWPGTTAPTCRSPGSPSKRAP